MKQGNRFHPLLLLLAIAFLPLVLKGQPEADTTAVGEADYRISLLTCSPGEPLYSSFGHSAIRVQNRQQGLDLVFNYGTFDFDTPNFYLKFIRGKLLYQLAVQPFDRFMLEYEYEKRSVIEQPFLLTEEQAERFLIFLQTNYLPENREYRYDFFFDNCATRIRDIAEQQLGTPLIYPAAETTAPTATFRQLLHDYLPGRPWMAFGFDIILGLPTDRVARFREQMFLPDYLAANLSTAALDGRPLLGKPETLLTFPAPVPQAATPFTPAVVFGVLAFLSLALSLWRGGKEVKWVFDRLLLLSLGLLGLFLLFMWLGTDHVPTRRNLNLLWASPLYLIVLAWWRRRNGAGWPILYGVIGVGNLLLLAGWGIWPQAFHPVFVLIIATVLFRCADHVWEAWRQRKGNLAASRKEVAKQS